MRFLYVHFPSRRRDELMRKIRELGSLPSDAFSTYQGLSAKQLQKVLAEANKEMSKFQHVNQKALDQYINFNEQRRVQVAHQ